MYYKGRENAELVYTRTEFSTQIIDLCKTHEVLKAIGLQSSSTTFTKQAKHLSVQVHTTVILNAQKTSMTSETALHAGVMEVSDVTAYVCTVLDSSLSCMPSRAGALCLTHKANPSVQIIKIPPPSQLTLQFRHLLTKEC